VPAEYSWIEIDDRILTNIATSKQKMLKELTICGTMPNRQAKLKAAGRSKEDYPDDSLPIYMVLHLAKITAN